MNSIRRRLAALLLVTAFVVASPRAARAQFLPAADVYKEVSELIEDLIRAEVGKSVAQVIDRSVHQRYFKETAKRLRSSSWGALDATLERDLIELLVDYAYFTAAKGDASGQAFWDCVRAPAAGAKDCGFVAGKTLFETHCPPTAASLACDFAQTLSATLERKEEVARSSAVQLLGDLLLTGHLGEPEPGASGAQRAREAQFEAFRERLRAWMADPDGVRKQIDQLALDRIGFGFGFRPGHPESGASPVDDSVSPHALQRNAKTQPHTPKPVRIKPFTRGIVSQGK